MASVMLKSRLLSSHASRIGIRHSSSELKSAIKSVIPERREITLMDWGNAFVTEIKKEGSKVSSLKMTLHLEGDFKKTSKKITWLSTEPEPIEVELHDFDHLITKEKLEEGDEVADFITPKSEFVTNVVADVNVKELKKGTVIQFERKGYFIVDVPYSAGKKVEMFSVPDGKLISRYGVKA